MKKMLIGIHGKARSGKDTIANYLWAEKEFTRIAFADPLKRAAREVFGLSDLQMLDDSLKEVVIDYWGLSPRQIFQRLGTEAIRNTFGGDTWIKRFALGYDLLRNTDDVVVPDVRFDNEADYIRSQGGIIIEVRRDSAGLAGSEGGHSSEGGLSTPADFVIHNNTTIDALLCEVDAVLFK